ncbi:hypothetical protein ATCC90586_008941 [Pythium insidiosum]|nr:hypothetical protein ATCC90586_008941 [Pythium insidiosum]
MGKSVRKYRKNRDYEYIPPPSSAAQASPYDIHDGKGPQLVENDLLTSPREFVPLDQLTPGETSPLAVTMTMTVACVGVTTIVMPYIMLQAGMVMSIFLFVGVGLLAHWSRVQLVQLSVENGIYSLHGLAKLAFGRPGVALVSLTQLVTSLGLIIAYQSIMFQDIPIILGHWFNMDFDADGRPVAPTTGKKPFLVLLADKFWFGEALPKLHQIVLAEFTERYARILDLRFSVLTALTVFKDAKVMHLTHDEASWVYHVPRWYEYVFKYLHENGLQTEPFDEWFEALWEQHPEVPGTIQMFGRRVLTPRFQQAYGVTHRFSGTTFPSKPFPTQLQATVELLQSMFTKPGSSETQLNAGLLNWYKDGDHYMGPHSDDGLRLMDSFPVVSVTFGATRRFVFTRRDVKKAAKLGAIDRLELELGNGDLLIMGGTTQSTHKHALPKMKHCVNRRINLTLRCFRDAD